MSLRNAFSEEAIEPFAVISNDPAYYYVCGICHFVDREHARSRIGFPCPICGSESDGGYSYFPANISILVGLIRKTFYLHTPKELADPYSNAQHAQWISAILFFCSLREALLENFIREMCLAKCIEPEIADRLVGDNRQHVQKQGRLFPTLTGVKWKDAIKKLDRGGRFYKDLDAFIASTAEIRNRFLHEADVWSIREETARDCLENIPRITGFYVELHNTFAHPCWKQARLLRFLSGKQPDNY